MKVATDWIRVYSLRLDDAAIDALIESKEVHREDLAECVYLKGWMVWPDDSDLSPAQIKTEIELAISDAKTVEDAKGLIIPILRHLLATTPS